MMSSSEIGILRATGEQVRAVGDVNYQYNTIECGIVDGPRQFHRIIVGLEEVKRPRRTPCGCTNIEYSGYDAAGVDGGAHGTLIAHELGTCTGEGVDLR